MSREPRAYVVITESRSQPGCVSLRPYPRVPDSPTLQEMLTSVGFKPGDVVELRRVGDHFDRLPPPGQLGKRPRRRRVL